MGLALGDADDLGGMQRIELVLVLGLLGEEPLDQSQEPGEAGFQGGIAGDLARDVAKHPAEIGLQALELPAHALELPGMGITPGLARRLLGQAGVALAQLDAGLPWPGAPGSPGPSDTAGCRSGGRWLFPAPSVSTVTRSRLEALHRLARQRDSDRCPQDLFHGRGPNSLAPAGHQ